MGAIFEKYSGMIIGIIVAILLIGVVIVIGSKFTSSSNRQFNNLETLVNEQLEEIQKEQ